MSSYTSILMSPTVKPISTTLDSTTIGEDYRTNYEHILEFNEEVIMADLACTSGFYKGILESNNYIIHEGVFSAISAFIQKIVYAILNFFNFIFVGRGGGNSNESISKKTENNVEFIDKHKKDAVQAIANNESKVGSINMSRYNSGIYNGKDLQIQDISVLKNISTDADKLSNDVKADIEKQTNELQQLFSDIKSGKDVKPANTETEELVSSDIDKKIEEFKEKAKAVKVEEAEEFKSEELSIPVEEFSTIINNSDIIKKHTAKMKQTKSSDVPIVDKFVKMLESAKGTIDDILKKAEASLTEEQYAFLVKKANSIRSTVTKASEVSQTFLQKCAEVGSAIGRVLFKQSSDVRKGITSILGLSNKEAEDEAKEVEESYLAYTEAFSDALTSVMKDYKWRYAEIYKEGIVNEAVIYSKPGANIHEEMIALDEAIGSKVKSAFNTAVAKIKEIFAKFMEKLRRNVTTTRNYCNKYKKYIMETKINTDFIAKNIIQGMYNVTDYEVPAFEWSQVESSLTDATTFFNNKLKTGMKNFEPSTPPNGDQAVSQIAEAFKEYFGCAGPDITITAAQMQQAIPDIYNFMYDISKIEKSINNSIKRVEGMREAALKQAGVEIVQPTESFHYINRLPVMLEITDKPSTQNQQQQTQQQPVNATGAAAVKTVGANTQNSQGQEQYGVGLTKREDVDAKCNVYVQCAVAVLKAKLTAVEFLRNEFMEVFKKLVERNVEGNAEPAAAGQPTQRQVQQTTVSKPKVDNNYDGSITNNQREERVISRQNNKRKGLFKGRKGK